MTSTSQDFSCAQAIGRFFSSLLLLVGLGACGDSAESPTAHEELSSSPELGVLVDLDTSQLPPNLPDTTKVYVYLRNPGERMPLAVEHYGLSEIPASVVFHADQPMPRVEVVARISPLGKVAKTSGDIETTAITSIAHPQQRLTLVLGLASQSPPTLSSASSTPEKPKQLLVSVDYTGTDVLSPDLTVFIVAHAPGVAMPLAVKKLTMTDLPADVTLTDADSMLPSNNLSSAPDIEVSAHISVSGRIQKTPGNWVGRGNVSATESGAVYEIHINEKIN